MSSAVREVPQVDVRTLIAATRPWRLAGTLIASLVMVRSFVYGLLVLTPPRAWRAKHNYHHAHVGKIEGSETGNFYLKLGPIMKWMTSDPFYRLANAKRSVPELGDPIIIRCLRLELSDEDARQMVGFPGRPASIGVDDRRPVQSGAESE